MPEKPKSRRKQGGKADTPWEKPAPDDGQPPKHLTPGEKDEAKARARKAGRPYPNLVDNMAVARRKPAPGGKRDPQPGSH